jgi:hypothetical protein
VIRYLVDTSVWARATRPTVEATLRPLLSTTAAATCGIVDMEILYSARNGVEHARVLRGRRAIPRLEVSEQVWDRAIEVQGMLAATGRHRGAPLPDLIVAATAEIHGARVLHYDADFDLIAGVTGQKMEWVVPRGSID